LPFKHHFIAIRAQRYKKKLKVVSFYLSFYFPNVS